MTTRKQISDAYAQWIALSGTRSGSPLKAKKDIYPLIQLPDYDTILTGDIPITKSEFNDWHRINSELLNQTRPQMSIGWTTKLINLYLKTMVYVGQFGRPNLVQHIHPPIDHGLWNGILIKYRGNKMIIDKTHSKIKIKDIQTYNDYQKIIGGVELIAQKEGWLPIEVEQLWTGTKF